jgi:antiviral helicase SLH1
VIAPHHSIAAEIVSDLRPICRILGLHLELVVAGDSLLPGEGRKIRVIAASNLPSALSRLQSTEVFTNLRLVVCENLEQLNATYELGVSLLRHATQAVSTRFVGFSASLDDPADLAAWLDVHPFALHSFRPRDRDQSLAVTIQTFTIPHSAALIKAMVKPCHTAIKTANTNETAIVFVPSRSQCRPIALGLITQATLESETGRGYMMEAIPEEVLEQYVGRLRDSSLRDFISNGVGFFHDGIHRDDRRLMLQLFSEGMIRVIIASREACWTAPIRAGVVVVMGTQFLHIDSTSNERQIQDYSHTEIVRMQSRAVRHNELGRFYLFCQAESKDTYARFLDDGLPLESELIGSDALRRWYGENRRNGNIASKQAALDVLSWTFLARRVETNPVYYDSSLGETDAALSRIVDDLDDTLSI